MLNKSQYKLLLVVVVTLTFSGILFWQGLKPEFSKNNISPTTNPQVLGEQQQLASQSGVEDSLGLVSAKVVKVVDGDTIEVETNEYGKTVLKKIRYVGIDTPETVDPRRPVGCFGKEASNENKRLVDGKQVYMGKDVSETDKFGRSLRFVYLKLEDGQLLFVNDYLVREGFAMASVYPPDVKFSEQFAKAQTQARDNKRGLWASCK